MQATTRQETDSEGGLLRGMFYATELADGEMTTESVIAVDSDFVRQALRQCLCTVNELDSFCLDYFRAVYDRFAPGMERTARENLLLTQVEPATVYHQLLTRSDAPLPSTASLNQHRARPNPYRGLLSFGVLDAPFFCGRDKKVEELWTLFSDMHTTGSDSFPPRLLTVLGASGVGKSSLVQAGLLGRLRRQLPSSTYYVVAVMRPEARPLRSLARVLARIAMPKEELPIGKITEIEQELQRNENALTDLAGDLISDPNGRLLLVIDQLEELYTLVPSGVVLLETERSKFLRLVLSAVRSRCGKVSVVTTLRSDVLGSIGTELAEAVTAPRRVLVLGPLDETELLQAVADPARRAGFELPSELQRLLVEQALGQPGALPLLQYTLTRLWLEREALTRRQPATTYSMTEMLLSLGGVGGCLAQEAERLYQALNPESRGATEVSPNRAQQQIRRVLVRLLEVRQGLVVGRRRQALADLVSDDEDLDGLRRVVGQFAAAHIRLLTLSGSPDAESVELCHESLWRHWPRLGQWLREAEQTMPVLLRLAETASRWHSDGRPYWRLWRGRDMEELRSVLPTLGGTLSRGERAFARATITAARWRRNIAAATVVSITAASLGIGVLGLYASQQAHLAKERLSFALEVADKIVLSVDRRLEAIPGTREARKELLSNAAMLLSNVGADSTDSPRAKRTQALGHLRRGDLALTQESLGLALREYQAANQIFEALSADSPSNGQVHTDLQASRTRLADVAEMTWRMRVDVRHGMPTRENVPDYPHEYDPHTICLPICLPTYLSPISLPIN